MADSGNDSGPPDVNDVADNMYNDWVQQWTDVKSTIDGWSAQSIVRSSGGVQNQAQSASDWIAATADLTGRLSLLWLRGSWLVSKHLTDAVYSGAGLRLREWRKPS
ncbi:MAG: hypothetical protein QOJ19_4213 [Acidimicrobiia bacterium]|jgi:hypothetical protein|nr:hypothetical protein [Acidimicrobiia bacterium]